MNVDFEDNDLEELFKSGKTTSKKYKKLMRVPGLLDAYINVVNVMLGVEKVSDLRGFSFLHYEQLRYVKQSSVHVMSNKKYRLTFTEHDKGISIKLIEINEHYGDK